MTAARVGGGPRAPGQARQGAAQRSRPQAPGRIPRCPRPPPCPRAEDASAGRLMGAGTARGRDNGHEDLEGSRGAAQVARRLRRKPCHWNARRRTWPPMAARET